MLGSYDKILGNTNLMSPLLAQKQPVIGGDISKKFDQITLIA